VTLAVNDSRLFVTNQDHNSVSVIDTATWQEIAVIEVDERPEGISTHPNDQQVYVANYSLGVFGISLSIMTTVFKLMTSLQFLIGE
jgi:YVTN family beta-propeller protein